MKYRHDEMMTPPTTSTYACSVHSPVHERFTR